MTDQATPEVNENAFLRSLGVDPSTVKKGTIAFALVDGVPKMTFTATYVVPPALLAQALVASDVNPAPDAVSAPEAASAEPPSE